MSSTLITKTEKGLTRCFSSCQRACHESLVTLVKSLEPRKSWIYWLASTVPAFLWQDGRWSQKNLSELVSELIWSKQNGTNETPCLNKVQVENRLLRVPSDLWVPVEGEKALCTHVLALEKLISSMEWYGYLLSLECHVVVLQPGGSLLTEETGSAPRVCFYLSQIFSPKPWALFLDHKPILLSDATCALQQSKWLLSLRAQTILTPIGVMFTSLKTPNP